MNVLDLFSGRGNFAKGMEAAGHTVIGFCEIDQACRHELRRLWPRIPIAEDICKLKKEHLAVYNILPVDIITLSVPCQGISCANVNGKGLKDERSGLWFEGKRIIKEVRPKWVIFENVANLRTRGLARVIKDLHEIGYVGQVHIISATSIGAIHRRERIWIIAWPAFINIDGTRLYASLASEKEKLKRRTEAAIKLSAWWCSIDRLRKMVNVRNSSGYNKEEIKQLGNAVVPQIPELIGRAIMDYENKKEK